MFEYRNAANSAFVIEPRLPRDGTPAAARSGGGEDDKPLERLSGAFALREEDELKLDRERGITKKRRENVDQNLKLNSPPCKAMPRTRYSL